MQTRKRVAVLISGRGSNLAALIAAAADPAYPAEIALVLSNRPDAAGLLRAREAGIATAVVESRSFKGDRPGFEAAMQAEFVAHGIEIIALAGFMRILTEEFVAAWHDRMINIHPSLLPLFKGLDTHARALAAGVRLHGCTSHLVRPGVDEGPILIQAAVPVLPGDTEDSLAARVLAEEHRIYPAALAWLAAGQVRVQDGRASIDGVAAPDSALLNPLPAGAALPKPAG
jgi:phosphoribosylglycinamide formyltransferase-1